MKQAEITYQRKSNITFSTIDDEIVLIHPDEGKYYSFNKIGSEIWKLLAHPITLNEIKHHLLQRFQVSEEQCVQEVTAFLKQLSEKKLIDVHYS
ncbi:MAG: PqqD family peptide modification chaperone [Bacteroidales bacterium]|nr:PqqD family peptide modification chaperone [Bacteroidales bacterium]